MRTWTAFNRRGKGATHTSVHHRYSGYQPRSLPWKLSRAAGDVTQVKVRLILVILVPSRCGSSSIVTATARRFSGGSCSEWDSAIMVCENCEFPSVCVCVVFRFCMAVFLFYWFAGLIRMLPVLHFQGGVRLNRKKFS